MLSGLNYARDHPCVHNWWIGLRKKGCNGVAIIPSWRADQVLVQGHILYFCLYSSWLTCPEVYLSVSFTHYQFWPLHHSLVSLALRAHCYSISSLFHWLITYLGSCKNSIRVFGGRGQVRQCFISGTLGTKKINKTQLWDDRYELASLAGTTTALKRRN